MLRHAFFTFASLVAVVATTGVASAQETLPSDTAPAKQESAPYKQFTIVANPLSTIVGRYGIDVTWMPELHHAVVLNPFFHHVTATCSSNGVDCGTDTFQGFGGEVGYRYYTGEKGANGFFVGPSFLFGSYSESSSIGGDSVSFGRYGVALDIGGQAIIGDGFTIGGGFGLEYTKVTKDFNGDLPLGAAILAGGGVRPRFLFTIGYSF